MENKEQIGPLNYAVIIFSKEIYFLDLAHFEFNKIHFSFKVNIH